MSQLTGKRVAVLVTDGFEQSELLEPVKALKAQQATVEVVSPASGKVQGFEHFDKGEQVPVDVALADADAGRYDALVIPGGLFNPDALRADDRALAFTREFFRAGKPVGAICHGPWVRAAPSPRCPISAATWRTPARSGWTRRWWSTRAWSPAAPPTTCRRSAPSWSRRSARAGTGSRRARWPEAAGARRRAGRRSRQPVSSAPGQAAGGRASSSTKSPSCEPISTAMLCSRSDASTSAGTVPSGGRAR